MRECPYFDKMLSSIMFSEASSIDKEEPAESVEQAAEAGLIGMEETGGEYDITRLCME